MNKEELFMKNFGNETVFCLEYDKETLKDLVIELQQENKQLKHRIDKATEYMDNEIIIRTIAYDKLYEILKGENNE